MDACVSNVKIKCTCLPQPPAPGCSEFSKWSPGQGRPTQEALPESPVDVLQGMQTAGHTGASLPGTLEKSLWLKWQDIVLWDSVISPDGPK